MRIRSNEYKQWRAAAQYVNYNQTDKYSLERVDSSLVHEHAKKEAKNDQNRKARNKIGIR